MTANKTRTMTISVTTMVPTNSGVVWWPAEIDVPYAMTDAEALDVVNQTLVEDKALRVTKLLISGNGPARKITGRVPAIVTLAGLATITPMHMRLMEANERTGADDETAAV